MPGILCQDTLQGEHRARCITIGQSRLTKQHVEFDVAGTIRLQWLEQTEGIAPLACRQQHLSITGHFVSAGQPGLHKSSC